MEWRKISFTIPSDRRKYLEINLTKKYDLSTENCETVLKENFKNLNKDSLCSWSEDLKDGNTCQTELQI